MAVLEEYQPATVEVLPAGRDWSNVASLATLVVYGALVSLVISRHEPWFDEAQAWLIARESNPFELFRVLPYEGQPGLWHAILMLPAKTLPYEALNWISGLLGTLGVWFFLRRSPFPTPVKVLVPFSYFVFYQYGVVARNYALLPVVIFCLAAIYPERHEKPVRFALALFVLANSSTHGFLVAGALLAIVTVEALVDARRNSQLPKRSEILSVVALGVGMVGIMVSLLPPEDRTFAMDGPPAQNLREFLVVAGGMLNNSMADNLYVLPVVLAASLWFFRRRRVLHLYLAPTLVLSVFFAVVHHAPWHEGVLFLVWVFALWVGLQKKDAVDHRDDMPRKAALAALAVICLFQLNWTIRTAVLDYQYPYSGSRALAAYLKDQRIESKTIFGYHWASFALNPYFERNPFDNYNPPGKPSYWLWSERNHMVQDFELIEGLQPDYLVFPIKVPGAEEDAAKALKSYRQAAVFWGEMHWKGGNLQPEVYVLFARKE